MTTEKRNDRLDEVREQALAAALANVADNDRSLEAPPHVEQSVLAAFRRTQAHRREIAASRWLVAAAAVALITSMALALLKPAPLPRAAASAGRNALQQDLRGFVPVPYTVAIDEMDRAYVIRVEIPRFALASLGMPLASTGTEIVQADLLLAEDGMARAVRLVR